MRNGMIESYEFVDSLEEDNSKSSNEIASSICLEYISSIQNDNKLKEKYGKYLIWTLIGQLIIINIVFIFVGLQKLIYSNFTINLYVTASILEITALVTIIVKYLFSNKTESVHDMVKDYIKKD